MPRKTSGSKTASGQAPIQEIRTTADSSGVSELTTALSDQMRDVVEEALSGLGAFEASIAVDLIPHINDKGFNLLSGVNESFKKTPQKSGDAQANLQKAYDSILNQLVSAVKNSGVVSSKDLVDAVNDAKQLLVRELVAFVSSKQKVPTDSIKGAVVEAQTRVTNQAMARAEQEREARERAAANAAKQARARSAKGGAQAGKDAADSAGGQQGKPTGGQTPKAPRVSQEQVKAAQLETQFKSLQSIMSALEGLRSSGVGDRSILALLSGNVQKGAKQTQLIAPVQEQINLLLKALDVTHIGEAVDKLSKELTDLLSTTHVAKKFRKDWIDDFTGRIGEASSRLSDLGFLGDMSRRTNWNVGLHKPEQRSAGGFYGPDVNRVLVDRTVDGQTGSYNAIPILEEQFDLAKALSTFAETAKAIGERLAEQTKKKKTSEDDSKEPQKEGASSTEKKFASGIGSLIEAIHKLTTEVTALRNRIAECCKGKGDGGSADAPADSARTLSKFVENIGHASNAVDAFTGHLNEASRVLVAFNALHAVPKGSAKDPNATSDDNNDNIGPSPAQLAKATKVGVDAATTSKIANQANESIVKNTGPAKAVEKKTRIKPIVSDSAVVKDTSPKKRAKALSDEVLLERITAIKAHLENPNNSITLGGKLIQLKGKTFPEGSLKEGGGKLNLTAGMGIISKQLRAMWAAEPSAEVPGIKFMRSGGYSTPEIIAGAHKVFSKMADVAGRLSKMTGNERGAADPNLFGAGKVNKLFDAIGAGIKKALGISAQQKVEQLSRREELKQRWAKQFPSLDAESAVSNLTNNQVRSRLARMRKMQGPLGPRTEAVVEQPTKMSWWDKLEPLGQTAAYAAGVITKRFSNAFASGVDRSKDSFASVAVAAAKWAGKAYGNMINGIESVIYSPHNFKDGYRRTLPIPLTRAESWGMSARSGVDTARGWLGAQRTLWGDRLQTARAWAGRKQEGMENGALSKGLSGTEALLRFSDKIAMGLKTARAWAGKKQEGVEKWFSAKGMAGTELAIRSVDKLLAPLGRMLDNARVTETPVNTEAKRVFLRKRARFGYGDYNRTDLDRLYPDVKGVDQKGLDIDMLSGGEKSLSKPLDGLSSLLHSYRTVHGSKYNTDLLSDKEITSRYSAFTKPGLNFQRVKGELKYEQEAAEATTRVDEERAYKSSLANWDRDKTAERNKAVFAELTKRREALKPQLMQEATDSVAADEQATRGYEEVALDKWVQQEADRVRDALAQARKQRDAALSSAFKVSKSGYVTDEKTGKRTSKAVYDKFVSDLDEDLRKSETAIVDAAENRKRQYMESMEKQREQRAKDNVVKAKHLATTLELEKVPELKDEVEKTTPAIAPVPKYETPFERLSNDLNAMRTSVNEAYAQHDAALKQARDLDAELVKETKALRAIDKKHGKAQSEFDHTQNMLNQGGMDSELEAVVRKRNAAAKNKMDQLAHERTIQAEMVRVLTANKNKVETENTNVGLALADNTYKDDPANMGAAATRQRHDTRLAALNARIDAERKKVWLRDTNDPERIAVMEMLRKVEGETELIDNIVEARRKVAEELRHLTGNMGITEKFLTSISQEQARQDDLLRIAATTGAMKATGIGFKDDGDGGDANHGKRVAYLKQLYSAGVAGTARTPSSFHPQPPTQQGPVFNRGFFSGLVNAFSAASVNAMQTQQAQNRGAGGGPGGGGGGGGRMGAGGNFVKSAGPANSLGGFLKNVGAGTTGVVGDLATAMKWVGMYRMLNSLIMSIQYQWRTVLYGGIEYIKIQEQQTLGLKGIIAANYDIVDAQGKVVEGSAKYTSAGIMAKDMWQKVQIASFDVVGTSQDLLEIYNGLLPRVSMMGKSLDDNLQLTKNAALAGTALGISFDTVRTSLVSILNGNVRMSNSFTAALGYTEKQVKNLIKQNNLVEDLNSRFAAFNYTNKESNNLLQAKLETMKEMTGFFGAQITKPFTGFIKETIDKIQNFFIKTNEFGPAPEKTDQGLIFVQSLQDIVIAAIPEFQKMRDSLFTLAKEAAPNAIMALSKIIPAVAAMVAELVSAAKALTDFGRAHSWIVKLGAAVWAASTLWRGFGKTIITVAQIMVPALSGIIASSSSFANSLKNANPAMSGFRAQMYGLTQSFAVFSTNAEQAAKSGKRALTFGNIGAMAKANPITAGAPVQGVPATATSLILGANGQPLQVQAQQAATATNTVGNAMRTLTLTASRSGSTVTGVFAAMRTAAVGLGSVIASLGVTALWTGIVVGVGWVIDKVMRWREQMELIRDITSDIAKSKSLLELGTSINNVAEQFKNKDIQEMAQIIHAMREELSKKYPNGPETASGDIDAKFAEKRRIQAELKPYEEDLKKKQDARSEASLALGDAEKGKDKAKITAARAALDAAQKAVEDAARIVAPMKEAVQTLEEAIADIPSSLASHLSASTATIKAAEAKFQEYLRGTRMVPESYMSGLTEAPNSDAFIKLWRKMYKDGSPDSLKNDPAYKGKAPNPTVLSNFNALTDARYMASFTGGIRKIGRERLLYQTEIDRNSAVSKPRPDEDSIAGTANGLEAQLKLLAEIWNEYLRKNAALIKKATEMHEDERLTADKLHAIRIDVANREIESMRKYEAAQLHIIGKIGKLPDMSESGNRYSTRATELASDARKNATTFIQDRTGDISDMNRTYSKGLKAAEEKFRDTTEENAVAIKQHAVALAQALFEQGKATITAVRQSEDEQRKSQYNKDLANATRAETVAYNQFGAGTAEHDNALALVDRINREYAANERVIALKREAEDIDRAQQLFLSENARSMSVVSAEQDRLNRAKELGYVSEMGALDDKLVLMDRERLLLIEQLGLYQKIYEAYYKTDKLKAAEALTKMSDINKQISTITLDKEQMTMPGTKFGMGMPSIASGLGGLGWKGGESAFTMFFNATKSYSQLVGKLRYDYNKRKQDAKSMLDFDAMGGGTLLSDKERTKYQKEEKGDMGGLLGGLTGMKGWENTKIGKNLGGFGNAMGQIGEVASSLGPWAQVGMAAFSIFKSVFTSAARRIAARITKDIETIQKAYSDGSASMAQTISALEAQRSKAVTELSGRKGGQEQLDKILPELDKMLIDLKNRQREIFRTFEEKLAVLREPKGAQQLAQSIMDLSKYVKEYVDAGGDAVKANQFWAMSLKNLKDDYKASLGDAEKEAIDNALQLNDLIEQRADTVKKYNEEEMKIRGKGSLERQLPTIVQAGKELADLRKQRDKELKQLDKDIEVLDARVTAEREIFNLSKDADTLRRRGITLEIEANERLTKTLRDQMSIWNEGIDKFIAKYDSFIKDLYKYTGTTNNPIPPPPAPPDPDPDNGGNNYDATGSVYTPQSYSSMLQPVASNMNSNNRVMTVNVNMDSVNIVSNTSNPKTLAKDFGSYLLTEVDDRLRRRGLY